MFVLQHFQINIFYSISKTWIYFTISTQIKNKIFFLKLCLIYSEEPCRLIGGLSRAIVEYSLIYLEPCVLPKLSQYIILKHGSLNGF